MEEPYIISEKISKKQKNQILALVAKNANSLSIYVFEQTSPAYEYLSTRELIRTSRYLDRIGDFGADGANLIVTEDNGIIVAYILYHCTTINEKDISIASTIVDEKYRNQGILKNMMKLLKNNNESIALTCFVEKVPIYKSLDFKILTQESTQICMYYGTPGDGEICSVDDDYIDQNYSVKQALEKFKTENPHSWKTSWNQVMADNITEISKAKKFIDDIDRCLL